MVVIVMREGCQFEAVTTVVVEDAGWCDINGGVTHDMVESGEHGGCHTMLVIKGAARWRVTSGGEW